MTCFVFARRGCFVVAALALSAGLAACQQGMLPATNTSLQPSQMHELAAAAQLGTGAAGPAEGSANARQKQSVVLGGVVALAPPLRTQVRAGDTVFVVARDFASGKIVAVSHFAAAHPASWPMPFALADDRLIAGTTIQVSARVDKDGDASTKLAGDLVSEPGDPFVVPQEGVTVTVSQVL